MIPFEGGVLELVAFVLLHTSDSFAPASLPFITSCRIGLLPST